MKKYADMGEAERIALMCELMQLLDPAVPPDVEFVIFVTDGDTIKFSTTISRDAPALIRQFAHHLLDVAGGMES